MHICSAWAPSSAAAARPVQFCIKGFEARGDGDENGGDVRVSEVEVQGGGFRDEGELRGGEGHGGGGGAAEELGFEAVEVAF